MNRRKFILVFTLLIAVLTSFYYPTRRVDVESLLAGGGYIQRFGQNSGILIMLLYNFTESQYTPYQNPIIRIGVNIGL